MKTWSIWSDIQERVKARCVGFQRKKPADEAGSG
jgi:hypothetical protein